MHLRASGRFDPYSAVSRASGTAVERSDGRPRAQLQVEAEHRFLGYCAVAVAAADLELGNVVGEAGKMFGGHCWRIAVEVGEVEGMKHDRRVDSGLTAEEGRIVEEQSLAK